MTLTIGSGCTTPQCAVPSIHVSPGLSSFFGNIGTAVELGAKRTLRPCTSISNRTNKYLSTRPVCILHQNTINTVYVDDHPSGSGHISRSLKYTTALIGCRKISQTPSNFQLSMVTCTTTEMICKVTLRPRGPRKRMTSFVTHGVVVPPSLS